MNNLSEEKINPIPERPLRHLTRPLGIFDSGMGGMSIMAPLAQSLQGTCYYVADDAYAPYGPKTKTEILARADLITRQLLAWGCQLVLVACNTATAAAIKELRERFPIPLVGVEPYLNFLHQAALPPQASLAALMTPATFASEKYQQLKHKLDPQNQIQDFTMPRLASLIEAAVAQKYAPAAIKTIQEELRPLQGRGITHVILGCTHYPLIAELIEDFLGVQCVSPSQAISDHTLHLLAAAHLLDGPRAEGGLQIFCQKTSNPTWQTAFAHPPWSGQDVAALFYHRQARP